ncbi:MAG TPA: carbohydrate kinase family protein [Bryobacteraceae bacterium]|jgi:sugar/nucleoside kinase (ribokinase family)
MPASLFVFGDLCVDIVAIPQTEPCRGGDTTLNRLDLTCAGAAYNCSVAAARAGAQVEVIGVAGDDEFGRMLLAGLRSNGAGTSLVQSRANTRTGTILAIASLDGERTFYSYRGVNAEPYGPLPEQLLKFGDGVYLCGYSLQEAGSRETAVALRALAASSGAICLLDPSYLSASTLAGSDFLRGLDWITPNLHEAELLTGSTDPGRAAESLRAMGVKNVAITLGGEGCLVSTPTGHAVVPSGRSLVLCNTTGAGDAFCGGFLASLIAGCDPFEAARRGNQAAAAALAHNEKC